MKTSASNLNPCATAQLVDLCKAREVGNPAKPTRGAVDPQRVCSTFQSLIHGNSDNQVAGADIPPPTSAGGLWRKA